MKILLLLGSPHAHGTSATLAESFIKGAVENGHEVMAIDCAKINVRPCIGCNNCLLHGKCVWTDDMIRVEEAFNQCDAIVYCTPVYYAGVAAQLKLVIDRFYSFNNKLLEKKPKMALITAAAEDKISSTNAVILHFNEIVKYVGSESVGMVNAFGVPAPENLKGTDFEEKAYQLGKAF